MAARRAEVEGAVAGARDCKDSGKTTQPREGERRRRGWVRQNFTPSSPARQDGSEREKTSTSSKQDLVGSPGILLEHEWALIDPPLFV